MKKIIFILIFSTLAFSSFSQQIKPSPTLTKQDYFKKSKHQKIAARILLSSGVLLSFIGFTELNLLDFTSTDPVKNSNNTFFKVTGLAAIGASIPFFIASPKNKKKAANLSFKNEPTLQLQKNSFVYTTIPSLTLKINL